MTCLNLKPNEAYEPGFGKYSLTRSELRAAGLNKNGAESNVSKTNSHTENPGVGNGKGAGDQNKVQAKYNEQAISHYSGGADSTAEHEQKIREVNTNMHNNW
ncbi:hypothetical protein [Pontibacter cellulosilyticus]|uniref:Uncharacterized protein n=1 Tax=Pontibacter cellulosilyticus TaxID=1720253 RepID=A0A923N892_9BACT|nr:hypothetical protein [Pontibacter cellulosilyticus]MBC5992285.1 hypothetical protein [Pontibacter cellulosilyticus]